MDGQADALRTGRPISVTTEIES